MNKDMFVNTINFIKELNTEANNFNDMLKVVDSEFGGGYIHNKSIHFLVELLKKLTNDSNDWISYYCWEIDFGDKYYEGCVTEADGTPIPLKTPEDLYILITHSC